MYISTFVLILQMVSFFFILLLYWLGSYAIGANFVLQDAVIHTLLIVVGVSVIVWWLDERRSYLEGELRATEKEIKWLRMCDDLTEYAERLVLRGYTANMSVIEKERQNIARLYRKKRRLQKKLHLPFTSNTAGVTK